MFLKDYIFGGDMPLIQWIMQNLQIYRTPSYAASGTIFLYGDKTIASFSENYFARTVKFDIGSIGFDLSGTPWTVTAISAYSNQETIYTAKKNGTIKAFRDSEILVNQIPIDQLNSLQKLLDKSMENSLNQNARIK
jgi:hypothetical protein